MKPPPRKIERDRRLRSRACAYCGTKPSGSVDHIPPQCFFPAPRPTDLITVPCCQACNGAFSRDDLYAHITIAGRQDVGVQSRFSGPVSNALNSLEKPSNQKLRSMLAKTFVQRDARLPSGVVLPDQPIMLVDAPRLRGWLQRIVRGLYYHEVNERVPEDFEVTVGFGEDHPEVVQNFVGWFRDRSLRTSGRAVFEYKWMPIPDRPEASIWCMEFYRVLTVVGFIHPRLTAEERASSQLRRQARAL